MAECVVLASGRGTNFVALAEALEKGPHRIQALCSDRKGAPVLERAAERNIPAHHVSFFRRQREAAEEELAMLVGSADLVVLAGFMRILSPRFVDRFPIVNIHPSLLPRHPGLGAIERSFASGDAELGISIHWVDEGMDTGPLIEQHRIPRLPEESFEACERRIHDLEHVHYPRCISRLLDNIESQPKRRKSS